jgi:repressor LexA
MRTIDKDTLEKVAKYNIEYQKEHGISPSYRRIMNDLKLGSLATVQRYLNVLEKQGRIHRTKLGNIDTLPQLHTGEVTIAPLVGEVACGEPTLSVEHIEESFALPKSLFGGGELFMLRTFGDSMIDAGIEKGDLIVLRKQNYANDGEIVVALVDGENTLKRLFHRGNEIILHPENKTMEDIVVKECQVQGVLVSCIKLY